MAKARKSQHFEQRAYKATGCRDVESSRPLRLQTEDVLCVTTQSYNPSCSPPERRGPASSLPAWSHASAKSP